MAAANIGLVFEGGAGGTMGALARTVKENGGHVTGVILPANVESEKAFDGMDERHLATGLQERKRLLFQLSDGFVALPGGVRVLDALMEHLTWMHRGHPPKPVYLVNTAGYWDLLLQMFAKMAAHGFLPMSFAERFTLVDNSADALTNFGQLASGGKV
jgi:uncharacterized protein (TIGR00730 family)